MAAKTLTYGAVYKRKHQEIQQNSSYAVNLQGDW